MPKPLLMTRLAGTQAEMGAQHGRLVADDAVRLFEFYRAMPERVLAGDGGAPLKWVARQIASAWQTRLVRERKAEDADRTAAFIEAVRAKFPDRVIVRPERALATMDVLQNCIARVARLSIGPFAHAVSERAVPAAMPACSTAIAWGSATEDGELLFARNFDFPGVGVWDAAPAFVACAPDRGQRYGFFATRGADTCVVTVVNEAGLVIAPHTRWHRDVTWGGAMIVDVVHDIARRAETLEDAIRIAKERPISSSWGLAIGSGREKSAIVIEVAGPHVEIVRPTPGAEFLVCANRYRSSIQRGQFAASTAWSEHPERRERRLRKLVEERAAPLTARDLARFLGDRDDAGIYRRMGATLSQTCNVHCAVVKPLARTAWVGVDDAPSCLGKFARMTWTYDGPVGSWELGAADGSTSSGFDAEVLPEFGAPRDEATRHAHDAIRAHDNDHDIPASRAAIERAITAAPDDPSLRLAGLWLALADGAPDRAVAHAHAGLAKETESLRRGQLLLWGARAAQKLDSTQATTWFAELDRLSGVDDLQRAAKRPFRGRPHLNLTMVDAF